MGDWSRWMIVGVLAFGLGCIPPGGGGGGGRDDGGGVDGDGQVDPDDGVPPADMRVDPDDGVPPPDMAPDPDDGVPPPDMALDPDDGVPPPDMRPPVDDMAPPQPDGCAPQPEACNGLDDDCDEAVDEDFGDLGGGCEAGEGLCRAAGEVVCAADGRGTVCAAETGPPAEERCNGVDDDCDGAIDERLVASPCMTGARGRCGPGREQCLGGESLCVPDLDAMDEVCNGEDDDCDGDVDEFGVCDPCQGVECPDGFRCDLGECIEVLPFEVNCDDGIDDDDDGFVDCRDFDCDDPAICAGQQEFDCADGLDDDDNGFVDCADFACDDDPICNPMAAPECVDPIIVIDADRNIGRPDLNRCDQTGRGSTLPFDVWIRFAPPAGERLAEAAPPRNTCGTDAPGWLRDGHPAVEEGVVEATVCFSFNDPCNWQAEIEVRNCGDFYVYRLPEVPVCRLQYCVE